MKSNFAYPVTNQSTHATALRRAMCEVTDALGAGEPATISRHLERARMYAREAKLAAYHQSPVESMAAEYMANYVADVSYALRRELAPAII